MKRYRATITALTVLSISLAAPGAAGANSLLSGYGGPGEGNQAILGAALLNGPGGSGGGGSSSSTGASPATGLGAGTKPSASGVQSTRGGSSKHAAKAGSHGHASGSRSHTYNPASSLPAAQTAAVETSGTVGLSSTDLLYMLLALVVLVCTGAITRRLVRPAR